MPSNARKRKAAKRKKGKKTAHVDAPTNSQGNGGAGRDEHNHTSHDEKDSEAGDLSSPSSREPSVIGDRGDSSWSAGGENPMEAESEHSGFAKPDEPAVSHPSGTDASGDVVVEYVKAIEGDDGSSSGSSSDEESRSAQIATEQGELERQGDHSVVVEKTLDLSEQVNSSSQLSETSVVEPEAVDSATVREPKVSGDSTVEKFEEVMTSVQESGEASPSTLKAAEEVVSSVLKSDEAVPSLKEGDDKGCSAPVEVPSDKPITDADFPETGNRESTENEMGFAPPPIITEGSDEGDICRVPVVKLVIVRSIRNFSI
ncbi:hypothetical protein H6P81_013712 [Aristolochia fimbriata]|uniref:Uncharacterized protein n=1 Tax=Aristolochia fimbriata TaxID=158543 RepID=A0AAV7EFY4_ARIFI|nr:hypothetical protein H6P81_013712 [Aristolochia fimbriata]